MTLNKRLNKMLSKKILSGSDDNYSQMIDLQPEKKNSKLHVSFRFFRILEFSRLLNFLWAIGALSSCDVDQNSAQIELQFCEI
jgi:hypothetical protein